MVKHLSWRCCIAGLLVLLGLPLKTASGFDRPYKVVTSFYPIYIATANIVRNVPGVEVVNMTKPYTGCLHDYQMTTEDMVVLSDANVFVINGAGMESFLSKVLQIRPDVPVIVASKGIALLRDEHGENSHLWVSVERYEKEVENIAEELARLDPEHAEPYRQNCADYLQQLERLRQRMNQELAHLRGRSIVTFHEAFAYFAEDFALHVAAVVEREPGSEPGARELAETIEIIRRNSVPAIFVEPQYPSRSAETIARETGAQVYTLDPVVSGPLRADAYVEIMERNVSELLRAFPK